MTKRATQRFLSVCVPAIAVLWAGCGDDPPLTTGPTEVQVHDVVRAARGGAAGVSVDATVPASAEQGTTGLDVRILGSGFEPGSDVRFLLKRKETTDIVTTSTTFVSDTEVIANINVATTAEPTAFDVKVETPRGRKGIGIELFEVTGTPQECQLGFDLTLGAGALLGGDGSNLYQHGTDRVAAFTGSTPGFRFDNNGTQKVEARNDRRRVRFNLAGGWEDHAPPGELKGLDLRFDDPGLNLCTMFVGEAAFVPLDVGFVSSLDGERLGLKYGGATHRGIPCTSPAARVERIADRGWTIVAGPEVCIVQDGYVLDVTEMPAVDFTILSQDPVP